MRSPARLAIPLVRASIEEGETLTGRAGVPTNSQGEE